MYPCLPIRLPAHVFFTIMKCNLLKVNESFYCYERYRCVMYNVHFTIYIVTVLHLPMSYIVHYAMIHINIIYNLQAGFGEYTFTKTDL